MKDMNPDVLKKCIKNLDDGVIITLEIKPGSKAHGIEGVNPYRESLIVRVKGMAQKGKANMELIKFFSEVLALPTSNIAIKKGAISRKKEIKFKGISQEEIISQLIRFMSD